MYLRFQLAHYRRITHRTIEAAALQDVRRLRFWADDGQAGSYAGPEVGLWEVIATDIPSAVEL